MPGTSKRHSPFNPQLARPCSELERGLTDVDNQGGSGLQGLPDNACKAKYKWLSVIIDCPDFISIHK